MELFTYDKENVVVIELRGKLIGGDFMQVLNETLHRLLDKEKKNIILDVEHVSTITSTGIGTIISAYTTMKNGNGSLKLANANDKVIGALAVTKLDSIFEFYLSVDDALKSY